MLLLCLIYRMWIFILFYQLFFLYSWMAFRLVQINMAQRSIIVIYIDFNTFLIFRSFQQKYYLMNSQAQNYFSAQLEELFADSLGQSTEQIKILLDNNAKQFAYLSVKGINGDFSKIVQLMKVLDKNLKKLIRVTSNQINNSYDQLQLLINIIKPSLISQKFQVALAGCQTLINFSQLISGKHLNSQEIKNNIIYDILDSQSNGFNFLIMGGKRHTQLIDKIAKIILIIFSSNKQKIYNQQEVSNFFINTTKNILNNQNEYLKIVSKIIQYTLLNEYIDQYLSNLQFHFKQCLVSSKLLTFWEEDFLSIVGVQSPGAAQNSIKQKVSYTLQTRLSYTQLIKVLFMSFYQEIYADQIYNIGTSIETLQKMLNQPYQSILSSEHHQPIIIQTLLTELTNLQRMNLYAIKVPAIRTMTEMLKFLAQKRNKIAAIIYRKIIFMLLQNYYDAEIRQIISYELINFLQDYQTIPASYLSTPLIRQLKILGNNQIQQNIKNKNLSQIRKKHKMQDNFNKNGQYFSTLMEFDYLLITQLIRHPTIAVDDLLEYLQLFLNLFIENMNVKIPISHYGVDIYTEKFLNIFYIIIPKIKTPKNKQYQIYYEKILPFIQRWLEAYQNMLSVHLSLSKTEISTHSPKIPILAALTLKKMASLRCLQKIVAIFMDWKYASLDSQLNIQNSIFEDEEFLKIFKYMINLGFQRIQHSLNFRDNQLQKILKTMKDIKAWKQLSYNQIRNSPPEIPLQNNKPKQGESQLNISPQKKLAKILTAKPSPQIQRILEEAKAKYKQKKQHQAKILKKQEAILQQYPLNEEQMLQRNISLGLKKLIPGDVLARRQKDGKPIFVFQFDSVKKSVIKTGAISIPLKQDQNRELQSLQIIYSKYEKYIDVIFNKFSSLNEQIQSNQKQMISYSDIAKMFKRKQLLKGIPKILLNEIISAINSKKSLIGKNILAGIYQEDFLNFLINVVDLLWEHQQQNIFPQKKDEPLGMKLQKLILSLLEPDYDQRGMYRELFDPRITNIKDTMIYHKNSLDQLLPEQSKSPQQKNAYIYEQAINKITIPEGYKRIKQQQVLLNYSIRSKNDTNIPNKYIECYEILDEIFYEAVGFSIMTGYINYPTKYTIVPQVSKTLKKTLEKNKDRRQSRHKSVDIFSHNNLLQQNASRKNLLQNRKGSVKTIINNPKTSQIKSKDEKVKRSSSQNFLPKINNKQPSNLIQNNSSKKSRVNEAYNQQLKAKLQVMRQQKQRRQSQLKQEEERKRIKQKQTENKKKEYYNNQKKIVQEYKQQKKKKKTEEPTHVVQSFQAKIQKQSKLLAKQLAAIKKKKYEAQQRLASNGVDLPQADQQQIQQNQKAAEIEKQKQLIIQKKLKDGQLADIVNKYKNKFTILFESYWIWQLQKIDLKKIAAIFKDFYITQQYVTPHMITEIYNSVSKGKPLNLDGFIELIVKISYKSPKIQQQCAVIEDEINQSEQKLDQLSVKRLSMLIHLLGMNEKKYKQFVVSIKRESKKGTSLDI